MSSFDDWYVTKITTYVFSSKADENLAREAYIAGMERAAEITESFPDASNRGALVLCAEVIRREIT